MLKKLIPLKSDPILGLAQKFNTDRKINKINLTIGELYYTKNNSKHLFDYQYIINEIHSKNKYNFHYLNLHKSSKYLPIVGDDRFIKYSEKFIFGNNKNREGIQTLSGTGSLNIGNHIVNTLEKEIYIPSLSWSNHYNIFTNHVMYNDILELDKIKDNSIVLLHTCCNNPTGVDYTKKQWNYIMDVFKKKNHIAFFDSAYLGLASGNHDMDAGPIREVENNKIKYIVSTSYAKNFGLYGQRIGSLFYNFNDEDYNNIIKQYVSKYIRSTYSSPPRGGAEMAVYLMENNYLMNEWRIMLNNIIYQQTCIRKTIDEELGWNTQTKKGLFIMAPLSSNQIKKLRIKYGIYMLDNGRMNISGLDNKNIEYFIEKVKNINYY